MSKLRALLVVLIVALFSVGCRGDVGASASSAAARDGAMTNEQVRDWYNAQVATIPEQNQAWLAEGLSAELRAQRAYAIRHDARIEARNKMSSEAEVEQLRARDQAKYGDPDGPTFEYLVDKNRGKGLEGDAIYEAIIESSARTDEQTNARFRGK
ncbi:hypothetical protein [Enhygromyxa salina]|uniref:Lipoprotein n=1 Tax=Enhygromyxa salina TaxID=215803 RepID=A0A2S9YP76_9BACT|nr:hypothetical protein [Enhygromyxa salina]PRQ06872.1 hypothetical protein ENSA7_34100 [Enhygromyxa salina]